MAIMSCGQSCCALCCSASRGEFGSPLLRAEALRTHYCHPLHIFEHLCALLPSCFNLPFFSLTCRQKDCPYTQLHGKITEVLKPKVHQHLSKGRSFVILAMGDSITFKTFGIHPESHQILQAWMLVTTGIGFSTDLEKEGARRSCAGRS